MATFAQKRERERVYNEINEICEKFFRRMRDEIYGQAEMEGWDGQVACEQYFGTLWKKLERLFASQVWDGGEFRSMSWDEVRLKE